MSLEKYLKKAKKGGAEYTKEMGHKSEIALKKKNGEKGEKIGDSPMHDVGSTAKKIGGGADKEKQKASRPYLDDLDCY